MELGFFNSLAAVMIAFVVGAHVQSVVKVAPRENVPAMFSPSTDAPLEKNAFDDVVEPRSPFDDVVKPKGSFDDVWPPKEDDYAPPPLEKKTLQEQYGFSVSTDEAAALVNMMAMEANPVEVGKNSSGPVVWSALGRKFWVEKEDWSPSDEPDKRCYVLSVRPLEVKDGYTVPYGWKDSARPYMAKECRHDGLSTFEFYWR